MSLDDLREHGVLLPEEEWGTRSLASTVPVLPTLLAFLGGVAGLVVTFLGDGRGPTWAGVALFLAAFFALTWLADRAVRAQRRRVAEERRRAREEPGGGEAGGAS